MDKYIENAYQKSLNDCSGYIIQPVVWVYDFTAQAGLLLKCCVRSGQEDLMEVYTYVAGVLFA